MGKHLAHITKNIGFVTAASIGVRLLNLLLQATIARKFGPEGLGGYAIAIALAGYFIFIVDVGLSPRLVREGAVHPEELSNEYARAMGLKIPTAILAALFLAGLYCFLPYDAPVRILCAWLSAGSIIESISYLNLATCQAKERMDLHAIASITHAALFVGVGLLLFFFDFPLGIIGPTFFIAALFRALLTTIFARRFISLSVMLPPHMPTARASMPYAMTSLTSVAFAQIDILILSLIASQEITGHYAAISRLLLTVGFLSSFAGTAALPTISRMYSSMDSNRFKEIVNAASCSVALLGGLATVATFSVAREVIGIIYGAEFLHLSPLLVLGSFYIVLRFLSPLFGIVLTSSGKQSWRARSLIIGVLATVIGVLALVPSFGVGGAVAALVISEFILMACLAFGLRDLFLKATVFRTAFILVLNLGLSFACHRLLQLSDAPQLLSIFLPSLVYIAIATLSGELHRTLQYLRTNH